MASVSTIDRDDVSRKIIDNRGQLEEQPWQKREALDGQSILAKIAHCQKWPRPEKQVRANQKRRQKQVSQSRPTSSLLSTVCHHSKSTRPKLWPLCAACFEVTISSYVRLTSIGSFPVEQCLASLVCVPLPSTSVASGCFKCHKPSTQFTADNFWRFTELIKVVVAL